MSDTTTELKISGMTCGNCARHVAEALRTVPSVQTADVQLEENAATVRWKNGGAWNNFRCLIEKMAQATIHQEISAQKHRTRVVW